MSDNVNYKIVDFHKGNGVILVYYTGVDLLVQIALQIDPVTKSYPADEELNKLLIGRYPTTRRAILNEGVVNESYITDLVETVQFPANSQAAKQLQTIANNQTGNNNNNNRRILPVLDDKLPTVI
jgi:hypothetical protein